MTASTETRDQRAAVVYNPIKIDLDAVKAVVAVVDHGRRDEDADEDRDVGEELGGLERGLGLGGEAGRASGGGGGAAHGGVPLCPAARGMPRAVPSTTLANNWATN
jgi:hypothetical protein